MTEEKFIQLVKRHPVLYNISLSEYRDHNVRLSAWEEIAGQMNTTAEEVKNRWGKLRNCYTNALKRRRKKSGQETTNLVPWKFEKQMQFLLPHIRKQTVTKLGDSDENSIQDSESQFSEESLASPFSTIRTATPGPSTSSASAVRTTRNSTASITLKRRNRNDSNDVLLREMVDVIKSTRDSRQKRALIDMDENDFFFLSMSKQLKRLPKTDQAEIKFQLHKLIHDSEMKMLKKEF